MAQTQEALAYTDAGYQPVPYTRGTAIAAGEILSFGTGYDRLVAVANAAFEANEPATIDVGSRIYKVKKKASTTFAVGEQVGWDDGLNQGVNHDDATLDFHLGVCVVVAAAADDFVLCKINAARGWEGSGSGL